MQGSPTELSLAEETVRIFDIDQLSGTSMALFADVYDKNVDNIMTSQRGLTSRDQMVLSPLQVGVLCASDYVSDAP